MGVDEKVERGRTNDERSRNGRSAYIHGYIRIPRFDPPPAKSKKQQRSAPPNLVLRELHHSQLAAPPQCLGQAFGPRVADFVLLQQERLEIGEPGVLLGGWVGGYGWMYDKHSPHTPHMQTNALTHAIQSIAIIHTSLGKGFRDRGHPLRSDLVPRQVQPAQEGAGGGKGPFVGGYGGLVLSYNNVYNMRAQPNTQTHSLDHRHGAVVLEGAVPEVQLLQLGLLPAFCVFFGCVCV